MSPNGPLPMSKSNFAVKFRGFAFVVRSTTHRSGWVYEFTGWVTDATNASCLPSGLSERPPKSMSIKLSLVALPPLALIE